MSLKRGWGLSSRGSRGLGSSSMGSRSGNLRSRGGGLARTGRLSSGSGIRKSEGKPANPGIEFEDHIVDLYNKYSPSGKARRQRGSGAQWFRPGDILTPEFLIEAKGWGKPVIRLNWLEKLAQESLAYSNRVPIFVLKDGKRLWAVLRKTDIPSEIAIPEPTIVLKGGAKQATVPDGDFKSFNLSFKGSDQLYTGVPLLLLFCRSNYFLRGNGRS